MSLLKTTEIAAAREERLSTGAGYIAEALVLTRVPCLSPSATLWMLTDHLPAVDLSLKSLTAFAATEPSADSLVDKAKAYRAALDLVMTVNHHMQGAVLDGLQGALRESRAKDAGLLHPDDLETYEAMMKLADLGKKK